MIAPPSCSRVLRTVYIGAGVLDVQNNALGLGTKQKKTRPNRSWVGHMIGFEIGGIPSAAPGSLALFSSAIAGGS